jgi:hypothetical protein
VVSVVSNLAQDLHEPVHLTPADYFALLEPRLPSCFVVVGRWSLELDLVWHRMDLVIDFVWPVVHLGNEQRDRVKVDEELD